VKIRPIVDGAVHTGDMDDRDLELPVATLQPRLIVGRLTALRGAAGRWIGGRLRALRGRHAPLLLTSVVFSAMMLAMGYVADRAQRAGEGIDHMHRAQRAAAAATWRPSEPTELGLREVGPTPTERIVDPWPTATPRHGAQVLFYIRSSR
jgi:hypothetical protein